MTTPQTDIWQFQAALCARLMQWANFNIGGGLNMIRRKDSFWQGFGAQCMGWGLINAGLAWFGLRSSRRKTAEENAHTLERQKHARHTLARLLWINTGLDVIYVAAGLILANTGRDGETNRASRRRGTGWGIVLQGAFLFLFDFMHALRLSDQEMR